VTARAEAVLDAHGLADPDPDAWYPQRSYLDACEEAVDAVCEAVGDGARRLGEGMADSLDVGSVSSPLGALKEVAERHQRRHRGGDVGYYDAVETGGSSVRVECRTPYPCAFDSALVRSAAASIVDGVSLKETSTHCRAAGGQVCAYRLSW